MLDCISGVLVNSKDDALLPSFSCFYVVVGVISMTTRVVTPKTDKYL